MLMSYIKGTFKQTIFKSDAGYTVGVLKVKETDDLEMETFVKKSITFTGYFSELTLEDDYILYGSLTYHDRYGYQYNVINYEKLMPEGKDAIIEFLTSPLIKGCGEKTATKIVNILGEKALVEIKNNPNSLDLIPNLSQTKKMSIYNSILKYYESNETIIKLKEYGFSIKDSMKLISIYGSTILSIIKNNIYSLTDIIEFKVLDKIYLNIYKETTDIRILACIIETMKRITFIKGDTYSLKDEILYNLYKEFNISITDDKYFYSLEHDSLIYIKDNKYYLKEYYEAEVNIARNLKIINNKEIKNIKTLDKYLEKVEKSNDISYNEEQKEAIKAIFLNNIVIITGGPGTGKTTIVKGILNMYKSVYNLSNDVFKNKVALLAPTGRASKRLAETTNFKSSTIHRFLKWNKESSSFGINEYNKANEELIIIDETSMIDTLLFDSLLKGLNKNVLLVLVGDEFQLPSVSPGLVLNDLLISEKFKHIKLNYIYRQSKYSYIPLLAKEIKEHKLVDFTNKKDDYNFIECNIRDIKNVITNIISKAIDKGLTENDIQVLIPMYKGEIGIDNINVHLQNIFNPYSDSKKEVRIGSVIYRENDKVLNLVNDIDKGIYNGDIGNIYDIDIESKNDYIRVNFDNNIVSFKKDELNTIKHAYAISIHKSQGSEFNHVIMPISKVYNKMLYNKLIYTAISRAKKTLTIVGNSVAFYESVINDYSIDRKTTLKDFIMYK